MHSRRNFIKLSATVSIGFIGLNRFAQGCTPKDGLGYGDLIPDPKGILDLPKGFTYKIISETGTKMTDGFYLPGAPDGMATFSSTNGKTILIRNHELNAGNAEIGPFGKNNELLTKIDKSKVYDFGKGIKPGMGGTTTLVYDEDSQKVETEYLSLAGTIRNCAGGPTPWNSWITCEETIEKVGGMDGALEKDHGYTFEVPASAKVGLAEPVPIKGMGRFNHEAVCVDPRTNIVYLTEDRPDGLIYRYLPNDIKNIHKGGKLQALAVKGSKSMDTRNWENLTTPKLDKNKEVEVEWIHLENVEAPDDDLRLRGFESGAARFARGEGMWFGNDEIFFACTSGGTNNQGQIFKYLPSSKEGTAEEKGNPGKLELFIEPNDSAILKSCDNLTVAPWGDIIVCEDDKAPFVLGITPEGQIYKFARNAGHQSEFAGATFSPSGKTLFVNMQGAGLTLAITGPWK
ncbi:MAG TPA: alkaline phosphatase PhoX [Cytophagales bacterium]|nr:alkaline phosphatase PhoX [Cytophagales bacterium]